MTTYGSLFSGIGLLDLGCEWAGLGPCLWQVEKEAFPRAVLAKHWPGVVRHEDVCDVGAHNLAPVDVVVGSFPCQDLSAAGKREGLHGKKSGLWSEQRRILGELRPRGALIENVASGARHYVCEVRDDLHQLGYRTRALKLSGFGVGAPHWRERIFILAARGEAMADAVGDAVRLEPERSERQGREVRKAVGGDAELVHAGEAGGRVLECGLGGAADGRAGWVAGRGACAPGEDPGRFPARPGERRHDWEAPFSVNDSPLRALQLRAYGNAVMPLVAKRAMGELLTMMGLATRKDG